MRSKQRKKIVTTTTPAAVRSSNEAVQSTVSQFIDKRPQALAISKIQIANKRKSEEVKQEKTKTPIQRIKTGYQIQLPPDERYRLANIVRTDDYDQDEVNHFVDQLDRKKLSFYESLHAALLDSNNFVKKDIEDPFDERKIMTLWQCPNCKQPTTYQGIHKGHITDWRLELKKAGVRTKEEAEIVYNNMLNLHIECASCNVSHAFERDENHNFKDLPTQKDFLEIAKKNKWTQKLAKAKHKEFLKGYDDVDMDEYDLNDDFIDDSELVNPTEYTKIHVTSIGDGGRRSGLCQATQVFYTGTVHPMFSFIKEVEIFRTMDSNLSPGQKWWCNTSKSTLL